MGSTEVKETGRYLITTADERTWKFDRPVLFLGEWCRLYDRRHVWQQYATAGFKQSKVLERLVNLGRRAQMTYSPAL